MKIRIGLLALVLSLVPALSAPAQSGASSEVIAVRCGRLVDVKAGTAVQNAVVITNGRVTDAGPGVAIPKGATVVDLSRATVLPGLIDCHTHLLQNYEGKYGGDDTNMVLTVTGMSTAKRALLGAKLGREDLEAGITTVRDVGNSGWNGDVALRDAINAGWVVGPRVCASTRALAPPGGQFGRVSAETQSIVEQEYAVVAGPDSARRAVRQAVYDGADCIKVIVNSGGGTLSPDEMAAIVDEAHRSRRKVAAHAIGDEATRIAANAGVDSIEHAYVIPDDVLATMAEKKIFLVPTDYPIEMYVDLFKASRPSDEDAKAFLEDMAPFVAGNADRIRRAMKAGVVIAAGSDEYYQVGDRTRGQASLLILRAYRDAGMSPIDVIRAATVNAAELLGWSNRVGTIEKGKLADLIAVEGDPLSDVTVLERVKFVMKAGRVVRNDLTTASR